MSAVMTEVSSVFDFKDQSLMIAGNVCKRDFPDAFGFMMGNNATVRTDKKISVNGSEPHEPGGATVTVDTVSKA